MPKPTYLFYDLETTGLNYAFDQALQFAAIRTDTSFRELERHNIFIRLRPDVIPAPEAMIAHCISIDDLAGGACEYDAVRDIHALLNRPNTVNLGYNTLGFDDEFLRFSFYRNLLPPYTHQYAQGCGRMDLFPLVVVYWLHKPDILDWPEIDGKVSFKLEHLKTANTLAPGTSHDALVDVQASVELAKRLRQERRVWNYLLDFFHKNSDSKRIQKLPTFSERLGQEYRWGLMTGALYGVENNFQAPVLYLGNSEPYSNQSLWLRLDTQELPDTTKESFRETPWIVRKKLGQPNFVLPPLERHLEKVPASVLQAVEENKEWLEKNPKLLDRISRYQRAFTYPVIPDVDADALLYQEDFLSRADETLARRFHQAPHADKRPLCEQFESGVAQTLAERILFRNDLIPGSAYLQERRALHLQRVCPADDADALLDHRERRKLTPAQALQEIAELKQQNDLTALQTARLDELATYLRSNFATA